MPHWRMVSKSGYVCEAHQFSNPVEAARWCREINKIQNNESEWRPIPEAIPLDQEQEEAAA